MRVAGRQKGSKVKPYTHVVVQPSAPKSRYTFSYHSSESSAKAAQKKYEPLVGNPLKVVKQTGKSANTDMMEAKRIARKKDSRPVQINIVTYIQMRIQKVRFMARSLQQ